MQPAVTEMPMIEVFINAIKFLVSEDARTAGSSIVDLIRRTPEWQKGIGELEVRVSRDAFETAHLIRDLCVEKLAILEYITSRKGYSSGRWGMRLRQWEGGS
jgi:hypothetical protein